MDVTISCKRVACALKIIVNELCEEGFKWYPDAPKRGEDVSLYDLVEAINALEAIDDKIIQIDMETER